MPFFRRGGGSERSGDQPGSVTRQAGSQEAKTPEQLAADRRKNAAVSYAGMPQVDDALVTIIGQQFRDPTEAADVLEQALKIRTDRDAKAAGGNGTQG